MDSAAATATSLREASKSTRSQGAISRSLSAGSRASRAGDTLRDGATVAFLVDDGSSTGDEDGRGGGRRGPIIPSDPRVVVEKLESLQRKRCSPQEACPEVERLLGYVLAERPLWRQRMAVMSSSAWLRQKILTQQPRGARGLGCSGLGTTHEWVKKMPRSFSDHNWPKATFDQSGPHLQLSLPSLHSSVASLPPVVPSNKMRMDPTLSRTAEYTFTKKPRFPGTDSMGIQDKAYARSRSTATPGPGAYFKSQPRSTPFSTDGGETVILGANHLYPWKGSLGHMINPVESDHTTLPAAPTFSFPKQKRFATDANAGHGGVCGGAVKTDLGCLSPGPVYEAFGSMRPSKAGHEGAGSGRLVQGVRASRLKVRCTPMPIQPDPDEQEEAGSFEGFALAA